MKFLESPLFGVLLIVLFFALIIGIIGLADSSDQKLRAECERKGGTWFYNEKTCLSVPHIHLDNN